MYEINFYFESKPKGFIFCDVLNIEKRCRERFPKMLPIFAYLSGDSYLCTIE